MWGLSFLPFSVLSFAFLSFFSFLSSASAFSWLVIPPQLWISTIRGPGWQKEKLMISGNCRQETEWTAWLLQGLGFLAKSVRKLFCSFQCYVQRFCCMHSQYLYYSSHATKFATGYDTSIQGRCFSLVCSSFVSISRGSTHRSYFLPEGDPSSKSVQRGNLLAARIGLSNLKSQSNMIMIMNSDQHVLL